MYRILIVEDNLDYRILLETCLAKKFTITLEATASGEEAIAALKIRKFDLVICDYKMSGITGYNVFTYWKEEATNGHFLLWTNEDASSLPLFEGKGFLGIAKKVALQEVCEKIKYLMMV